MKNTKPLRKVESVSQEITRQVLPGGIRGIDVDLVLGHLGQWIVLEFLRCESVPARESHPSRYWDKNWRKFVTLWALAKKLEAKFYLVNYESFPQILDSCRHCFRERIPLAFGDFRVMEVSMNNEPSEASRLVTRDLVSGGFQEFKAWFVAVEAGGAEARS